MEPLKEMFNEAYFTNFARVIASVHKQFKARAFLRDVTSGLADLELNARLRRTSETLHKYLPEDFEKAVDVLTEAAPALNKGYTALVLPDYVGLYGQNHFNVSMAALRFFTSFGSSEFAVREFLKRDLSSTLKVMHKWAGDDDHHVRRLASEGSRPRLPWSFRLDAIIRNPRLTTGILETLRTDQTLYVKKSVANHLNDISKDNTDYMIGLVSSWDLNNEDTRWIVKHAGRNLIKQGHPHFLQLFEYEKHAQVSVDGFTLSHKELQIGDTINFAFTIRSKKSRPQKLVIDYVLHFPRSRPGAAAGKKVFKLKEFALLPGQSLAIAKKHSFRDLTTRKHYPGTCRLDIQVNGITSASAAFRLV